MASLNNFIDVQITVDSGTIAVSDTATPLILMPFPGSGARVLDFNSSEEVLALKLPPMLEAPILLAFQQKPRLSHVRVGRIPLTGLTIHTTPAQTGDVCSFSINGTVFSAVYSGDDPGAYATSLVSDVMDEFPDITPTIIAEGIALVFPADTVTSFVAGTHSECASVATTESPKDALWAVLDEDPFWYFLLSYYKDSADILELATVIESLNKLFVVSSSEADILDSTVTDDVLIQLQGLSRQNTALIYHQEAETSHPEIAWVARMAVEAPGSATWALKKLSGVMSSPLTATQRTSVFNKGGNTYERYGRVVDVTDPGKVCSGEWIDTIRLIHWMISEMQSRFLTLLINESKVGYTQAGIELVADRCVRSVLAEAVTVGGLRPDTFDEATQEVYPGFVVEVPLLASIPQALIDARTLEIPFRGSLAGAIQYAGVRGRLSAGLLEG